MSNEKHSFSRYLQNLQNTGSNRFFTFAGFLYRTERPE
jgi:hypothetical protein